MTNYAFLSPSSSFALSPSFDWDEYIEIERELWALFPETQGRRVNFIQIGLTAEIFAEMYEDNSELGPYETYILMPDANYTMHPIRMKSLRRLTLSEYRMGHLTAVKLIGKMMEAAEVMRAVGAQILGDEVLAEAESRLGPQNPTSE